MISIVIPVYNEERVLSETSINLQRLSLVAELIFVDGGSADRSADIARSHGKVFRSKKGRAIQMNCGANQATGDILLFLHADNIISPDALKTIGRRIYKDGYIGGCLTQRIDNKALIYRLIEWQGNMRARTTKEFYGDQGIFVKKNMFLKIGGFPEVPIMEDALFSRRLRKTGRTVVLPDEIKVSDRRWKKTGVFRTILLFNLIIILSRLKVPLHRIKKLYEDIR